MSNPLTDSQLVDYIFSFLNAIIVGALPILVLAILVTGFYFIAGRGSSEQLNTAITLSKKVLIGMLILFSLTLVFGFIKDLLISLI